MNTVYTLTLNVPAPDRGEILRYAGMKQSAAEVDKMLGECIAEAEKRLVYKVCYTEYAIKTDGDCLRLGFADVTSQSLKKNLAGCRAILVFAATLGLSLDRLIARYGSVSPAKALLLQAFGAERIEALCDSFCEQMQAALPQGQTLKPRFSPGYGDLPLTLQTDLFRALDCPRKIGLTLNQSLMMSPSKSVTAIIGITEKGTALRKTS